MKSKTPILISAFLVAQIISSTSTANAWFKVCNQSGKPVWFTETERVTTCGTSSPYNIHGWWFIDVNQCPITFSGSMSGSNIYFYAESTDGALIWDGGGSDNWYEPDCEHSYCLNAPSSQQTCTDGTKNSTWYPYSHAFQSTGTTNFTLTLTQ